MVCLCIIYVLCVFSYACMNMNIIYHVKYDMNLRIISHGLCLLLVVSDIIIIVVDMSCFLTSFILTTLSIKQPLQRR